MKQFCKILFLLGFIFISCNSIKIQETNSELEKHNAGDFESSKLSFSLNYPDYDNVPIVKMNLSNTDFYFLIDTGSSVNTLNKNGINKLLSYEKYKEIIEALLHEQVSSDFIKKFQLGGMNLTWQNKLSGESMEITFTGEYGDENSYDGILGIPFLRMHKNVTFDYVNRELFFNSEKLCDNEIQMIPFIQDSLYYINFTVGGKKERGLIDTGNSLLVTRKDFMQNDEYLTDAVLIQYIINGDNIKTNSSKIYKIRDMSIGCITYPTIISAKYDNAKASVSESARRFAAIYSSLGYSCFQNHIIQLDFENNLFRIK